VTPELASDFRLKLAFVIAAYETEKDRTLVGNFLLYHAFRGTHFFKNILLNMELKDVFVIVDNYCIAMAGGTQMDVSSFKTTPLDFTMDVSDLNLRLLDSLQGDVLNYYQTTNRYDLVGLAALLGVDPLYDASGVIEETITYDLDYYFRKEPHLLRQMKLLPTIFLYNSEFQVSELILKTSKYGCDLCVDADMLKGVNYISDLKRIYLLGGMIWMSYDTYYNDRVYFSLSQYNFLRVKVRKKNLILKGSRSDVQEYVDLAIPGQMKIVDPFDWMIKVVDHLGFAMPLPN